MPQRCVLCDSGPCEGRRSQDQRRLRPAAGGHAERLQDPRRIGHSSQLILIPVQCNSADLSGPCFKCLYCDLLCFLVFTPPFLPPKHSKICTNVHFICWFLSWFMYLKTQYWNLLCLWSSSIPSHPLYLEITAVIKLYQRVRSFSQIINWNRVQR